MSNDNTQRVKRLAEELLRAQAGIGGEMRGGSALAKKCLEAAKEIVDWSPEEPPPDLDNLLRARANRSDGTELRLVLSVRRGTHVLGNVTAPAGEGPVDWQTRALPRDDGEGDMQIAGKSSDVGEAVEAIHSALNDYVQRSYSRAEDIACRARQAAWGRESFATMSAPQESDHAEASDEADERDEVRRG